ncbi:MAG: Uma2 family endonuclease [Oculatellaceae cyanobacterium bins.114]|nr:Uma2 family endonuclease [Oculatellaceae cyanobacterium bins.114]
MSQRSYPVPQTDPPLSPRETLPTMYDLPSENPEEPGLPDEFHDLQPQLLSATLRLRNYTQNQFFTGSDLNLYYDVRHPQWYKRPDWFLVLGVPRLYDETDMRSSYVIWQEGVNPFVVVELLSPGTEKEDLGEDANSPRAAEGDQSLTPPLPSAICGETNLGNGQLAKDIPPRKWEVYEQLLRVPYYVVFSRYTNRLRFFQLLGGHYQEQLLDPNAPRIWIPELELGLGLWQGEFQGVDRLWLRWCDSQGSWMLTDAEQEREDKERAIARVEQVETQLRQVAFNLVQQGMSVEQVASLMQLTPAEVQELVRADLEG